MSAASLHKEVCPKCGYEQMVERYDSINDYHKELFPQIIDKSIFDYECESCKEKIHAPYPLLFHKMGFRDIQIGYKIHPIGIPRSLFPSHPLMAAMKNVMKETGYEYLDITEYYDDENEFAQRIENLVNNNGGT